jgi:hypothetical protein
MCNPYRSESPRFAEIEAEGWVAEVGRGEETGRGLDPPPVWFWCELRHPERGRISGTGPTKEEAFADAASRVPAL